MRAFLLALTLVPGAALADDVTTGSLQTSAIVQAGEPMCQNARRHFVVEPTQPARIAPLERERAANAYRPVLRLNGGCDVPVMIREGIGGGPDAQQ